MQIPLSGTDSGVLEIPEEEIEFETSTSGGPGGQHVNRVETRVTLIFDVTGSGALTDSQRARILERLGNRITRDGRLRVSSERHRSQRMNREDVSEKFRELMAGALAPERPRRPTRVPRAERQKRLEGKRHRSEIKKSRHPGRTED